MTATATKKIVVDLPEDLISRLNDIAALRCQPLESIIRTILISSLESLELQADAQFEKTKQFLSGQSMEKLEANAKAELSPKDKRRLEKLAAKSNSQGLTSEEMAEIQQFHIKIEAVAVTRAAALWLLRERRKAIGGGA